MHRKHNEQKKHHTTHDVASPSARPPVICIGAESFPYLMQKKGFYADKTLFLKKLFDSSGDASVLLFTRPRRFGKTLTLSMIESFLSLNCDNPNDRSAQEALFIQPKLAIASDKDFCDAFMGRYPVIWLTFKEVKGLNFEDALEMLRTQLRMLYMSWETKISPKKLPRMFAQDFSDTVRVLLGQTESFTASRARSLLINSILLLAQAIQYNYGKKVVLLIDEYDVPLQKAREHGFYDEMIDLLGGILSQTLKSNQNLIFKAILTGCLQITQESIFTGLNHFSVYTMRDKQYSGLFGFTHDEVQQLLGQIGRPQLESSLRQWYDGYNFGGQSMYCPWSVLKYCEAVLEDDQPIEPEPYWVHTSSNAIIAQCLECANARTTQILQALLDGQSVAANVELRLTYRRIDLDRSSDILLSLLYLTGYLTMTYDEPAQLRIPNREVMECFREAVQAYFSDRNAQYIQWAQELAQAFLSADSARVQNSLERFLERFLHIRDSGQESYYHGFVYGLLSVVQGDTNHYLASNPEAGDGFADITFYDPASETGVVIELKKLKPSSEPTDLQKQAEHALCQARDKRYRQYFDRLQPQRVLGYGVVFFGKRCRVKSCQLS